MSCIACSPNVKCPTLPDDCEPTKRGCGCCFECKGKVGATCSNFGLTCESGLMCVNTRGVAKALVQWDNFGFRGTCQEVDMCQLLTQSWYALLRDQKKLTARVVDGEAVTVDQPATAY
ncbi:hypothetical protein NP493_1041g01048 [Ridgeia piscesae]|uniref:IGFBP N-terminal domain-containing protein n=1 Tax=Ridgeia piscesae TaxID=27915 RepID=A0AAD9KJA5_RIDPI|nr:hypothetical protein NP493_1041g01048 [Ridgeia piscesae]